MRMRATAARCTAALALLAALWALNRIPGGFARISSTLGAAHGPVRILEFYANAAALLPGERTQLCYGVQNARSVRISPRLPGAYPSPGHCMEVAPEQTTHYTILAEGYDGMLAVRSLILPVARAPQPGLPFVRGIAYISR